MNNSEENKKSSEEDLRLLKRKIRVVDEGLSSEAKAELWTKIESAIRRPKRMSVSFSMFLRYVAVVAILCIATYYIYIPVYLPGKRSIITAFFPILNYRMMPRIM